MNVIFLNKGLTEALRAYGVQLTGYEGLTDIFDKLTATDRMVVVHQSRLLVNHPVFKGLGLVAKELDEHATPESESTKNDWDVFLGDGSINPKETAVRLSMLNCVVTADGDFVLFEDEGIETPVFENMLGAMSHRYSNDDILTSAIWKQFLKSCY